MEITSEDFEDKSDLWKEIAKELGIKLPHLQAPKAYKVLRIDITCMLCGTLSKQYIKMVKYTDGLWTKDKDLDSVTEEEDTKAEKIPERVRCCGNCKVVLLDRTKEELIAMLIKLHAEAPTRKEILKYIREIRVGAVAGNTERKRRKT